MNNHIKPRKPRTTPLPAKKIVAQNKRARFDYHIEDTFEAGIMLLGSEVKSLRLGKASIQDSYASAEKGEVFLINAHIPEYGGANRFNHEPRRTRKLLLHRAEIKKLAGKVQIKGITLVAISIYFDSHNRAKVEIGLAKGKQAQDKRETIKQREWDRDKARVLRGGKE